MPIFIPIMSVPKSGTHLLMKVLENLYQDKGIVTAGEINLRRVGRHWRNLFGGTRWQGKSVFVRACHEFYREDLHNYFRQHEDIRPIFLFRDPRDIAVSYVEGMKKKLFDLDQRVKKALNYKTRDPQLMYRRILWVGISNKPGDGGFHDELVKWGRWREQPNVYALKFKDLRSENSDSVKALAAYLGADEQALQEAIHKSIGPGTRTFRAGVAGGWKTVMNPQTQTMFRDRIGDVIEEWGYVW